MYSVLYAATTYLASGEKSLIAELFEFIKEKYFTLHLDEYSNLHVDGKSLGTTILCFFVGLNLASLLLIYNKRVLGDFVRALIKSGCLSPGSAKTLSELGFTKNAAVRGSLRSGVTLKRVVRCVEEEEYESKLAEKQAEYQAMTDAAFSKTDAADEASDKTKNTSETNAGSRAVKNKKPSFRAAEFKIDLDKAHFYVPEKLKYMAEIKFEKKGTDPVSFILLFIVSLIIVLLLFRYLPDIFSLLDSLIGGFKAS